MLRYRRNINCLTSDQLHDLREALATLYTLPAAATTSYAHIAGLHGNPSPSWCIHGSPGFLTWHRAYLAVFEDALRGIRPGVSLPYWNWSAGSTTGVPAACASPTYVNRNGNTVPNPLFAGPIAVAAGGGTTSRRANIATTTFGDLATNAQNAASNADFSMFQSQLNGVHGSVHVRVGGNMSSVASAGFDPIFYLHHANIDRLWANWQASHAVPLPPVEASLTLDPFKRCFSDQMLTGTDVFSTEALGYRYTNFCFFVVAWQLIGPVALKFFRSPQSRRFDTARLRIVSERMPIQSLELRFFAAEEGSDKFDAETPIEDNPAFLGSLGVLGMTRQGEKMPDMSRRGDKVDLQLDITTALQQVLRRAEQPQLTIVALTADGEPLKSEEVERLWQPSTLELLLRE
jgi:hypothetical protein